MIHVSAFRSSFKLQDANDSGGRPEWAIVVRVAPAPLEVVHAVVYRGPQPEQARVLC